MVIFNSYFDITRGYRYHIPSHCRQILTSWWGLSASGNLNVPTLTLAVVTTFHTALAKTADAQTKVPMMPDDAGDAQAFFLEGEYLCCCDEFSCNHLQ
jgi:hypothetical protein